MGKIADQVRELEIEGRNYLTQWGECNAKMLALKEERDQLKARVKELEEERDGMPMSLEAWRETKALLTVLRAERDVEKEENAALTADRDRYKRAHDLQQERFQRAEKMCAECEEHAQTGTCHFRDRCKSVRNLEQMRKCASMGAAPTYTEREAVQGCINRTHADGLMDLESRVEALEGKEGGLAVLQVITNTKAITDLLKRVKALEARDLSEEYEERLEAVANRLTSHCDGHTDTEFAFKGIRARIKGLEDRVGASFPKYDELGEAKR